MARNREFSQLGSFVVVDDNNGNIAITSTSTPYVGIGTTNPIHKLDVAGIATFREDVYVGGGLTVAQDIDFLGGLFQNGVQFNPSSGVGIGSTTSVEAGQAAGGAIINPRIGVGFTDLSFVGEGLQVTGFGSTIVIDFTDLVSKSEATVPGLTLLNSNTNLTANTSYAANTTSAVFTVTLPVSKQSGDFIEIHDTESNWDINNLMVATPNNEQFKNYEGVIDSPLACDVAGAAVKLVWTDTYWRVFA